MINRCRNARSPYYHLYGGRGIKVCERWKGKNGFLNFLQDMGRRPSPKHSIDRIDNNGNYEPGNCRWATRIEQNRNRRDNRLVTFNGQTKCIAEWCDETGLPEKSVRARLWLLGWSVEDALTTPIRALNRTR